MKVEFGWWLVVVLLVVVGGGGNAQGKHIDKKAHILRQRRTGFFTDIADPLLSMRRSIEGLTNNVGRSMHSLMSAISARMKNLQTGLYNRAPRLVGPTSSSLYAQPAPQLPVYSNQPAAVAYQPAYKAPDAYLTNSVSYADNGVHLKEASSVANAVYKPYQTHDTYQSHPSHESDSEQCNCSGSGPFLPVENTLDSNRQKTVEPVETVQTIETVQTVHTQNPTPTLSKPKETITTIVEYVPAPAPAPVTSGPVRLYPTVTTTTTISPPATSFVTTTTHPLTEQEICAHLKSLKEDLHKAAITHAGAGQSNKIDVHKLETIGVHSAVQQSSAVVPDQQHPEKYVSIECENVKQVVAQTLYYKDTKPLIQKLKGHNRVRESKGQL